MMDTSMVYQVTSDMVYLNYERVVTDIKLYVSRKSKNTEWYIDWYIEDILKEPYENLPTLIGSGIEIKEILIKWRLCIGQ
jgi:hypothetical protein